MLNAEVKFSRKIERLHFIFGSFVKNKHFTTKFEKGGIKDWGGDQDAKCVCVAPQKKEYHVAATSPVTGRPIDK